MYILKSLTGTELKVFFIILYGSEGNVYTNLESMLRFKLTYPTILKAVETLCKKNIIKKIQDPGTPARIEINPPYDEFSKHLKEFKGKLTPVGKAEKSIVGESHYTIAEIVRYYGNAKGISPEYIKEWYHQNIGILYTAARRLFRYTNALTKTLRIIDRAKAHFETRGFKEWTLQGALLRNIFLFLEDVPDEGGTYKVDTPIKKILCAYKILKGLEYDNMQWDQRHFAIGKTHAEYILKYFKNDWKASVDYIEEEAKYLKNQNLSFTIATLADRIHEWENRKREKEKCTR